MYEYCADRKYYYRDSIIFRGYINGAWYIVHNKMVKSSEYCGEIYLITCDIKAKEFKI